MLRLFLKNNLFKNKIKNIENFYETRDFIIKDTALKLREFQNYYESEAFKEYKPNLKNNSKK